jgi:hypothetical protein
VDVDKGEVEGVAVDRPVVKIDKTVTPAAISLNLF